MRLHFPPQAFIPRSSFKFLIRPRVLLTFIYSGFSFEHPSIFFHFYFAHCTVPFWSSNILCMTVDIYNGLGSSLRVRLDPQHLYWRWCDQWWVTKQKTTSETLTLSTLVKDINSEKAWERIDKNQKPLDCFQSSCCF